MSSSGLNLRNSKDLVVNSLQLIDETAGIPNDILDVISGQVVDVRNTLTSSINTISGRVGTKADLTALTLLPQQLGQKQVKQR